MSAPDGLGPRAVRVRVAPSTALEGDVSLTVPPDDAWRVDVDGGGLLRAGPAGPGAVRRALATRLAVPAGSGSNGAGVRRVEVVVDGWRFELEVEPAGRAALRERAAREAAAVHAGGAIEVRAIIPGRVVAVAVAMGDSVEAGGHLLVIEAMKMQNELRAPHAGVVERVAVTAGMTVERGELLVVLRTGQPGDAPDASANGEGAVEA